jgi:hypothetical protein
MINYKKIIKWAAFLCLLTSIGFPVWIFIQIGIDKETNPIVMYLEDKFHHPQRTFIKEAFSEIPQASPNEVALVIAADIAEGDIIFPLQKGYNLIAFDSRLIYYDLIIPANYRDKIKIFFKDWDYEALPKLDIVMASFILPLYDSETFQTVWKNINEKIKVNGYFVGNFFDPQHDIFPKKRREGMVFHTKQEVLAIFRDYEILKIQEIRDYLSKPKGNDHYYEVFAKKLDPPRG